MTRAPIVLTALALCACATPQTRIVTQDVHKPVPVECAAKVDPPAPYATDAIPLDSDIFALVKALLIERDQRRVAELNLRAALEGCRKTP
jgi:energy-converting hydrogenase Eha subunit F